MATYMEKGSKLDCGTILTEALNKAMCTTFDENIDLRATKTAKKIIEGLPGINLQNDTQRVLMYNFALLDLIQIAMTAIGDKDIEGGQAMLAKGNELIKMRLLEIKGINKEVCENHREPRNSFSCVPENIELIERMTANEFRNQAQHHDMNSKVLSRESRETCKKLDADKRRVHFIQCPSKKRSFLACFSCKIKMY